MDDVQKGFSYFFITIVTLAIIAVYITFFVCSYYIFNDPLISDNKYLQNLTISFLVLTAVQILMYAFTPYRFYYLHNILLIVNLALIVCIWIELKDTSYNDFVLPLFIVYTILVVTSLILTIVLEVQPKYKNMFTVFLTTNALGFKEGKGLKAISDKINSRKDKKEKLSLTNLAEEI